ncbi:ureidoglycolate hydrolase [Fusarium albosuccineum]|uniref:Ureidoglycolate hydrolase n=1 Tax=Fusarium albosuccineum TaxID=1237068 RepID=A0A8H4LA39_9HYPO|nr:ureidoglycolate hydrolase [Fusarium albosuccineum]
MAVNINVGDFTIQVTADRLTQEAFAPFGDVVANPRPDLHPTAFASRGGSLPYDGVSANQGTAIKYHDVSKPRDLYAQAPSGSSKLIMSQFVCEARQLKPTGDSSQNEFTVGVLERHPFTSQTFSPLMSTASMYLVIVAPSLPPSSSDKGLPVPSGHGLPGRGLPDLKGLRAFVATNRQAVTYGAGTWHAPMVALGKEETTLDFLVVQFASGVADEDCQLATFESEGSQERQIKLPGNAAFCLTMVAHLELTDARNKLEDLSGVVLKPGENPYTALIRTCNDNAADIQTLYSVHRTKRNAQQADKFLSSDFKELIIDQYLLRLEDQTVEPGFRDKRNCLVFWARPPDHVVRLAAKLQELLKEAAPDIWLMPTHRMHLTALEVAFSKTPDEIASLVSTLRPSIPSIVDYTYSHRPRLVKPMISYDLSAFAVSFLPASGEPILSPSPTEPIVTDGITQGDEYTYHHLRRDVFDKVQEGGVVVGSRYQVPSAHITLGRYLNHKDHDTPEKRASWVKAIDRINKWLETEVWDNPESDFVGEWIIGQEKGLDARNGTLWYGGGRTIMLGEGF